MLVLGLDPGTAATGYGVVKSQGSRLILLDYGVIQTPATWAMPERLKKIFTEIQNLIQQYDPDAMAIEEIFYHRNAKTVIAVAQSRGVALLAAAVAGIDIAEYTPLQVKQSVVGYGQAEKQQVQFMVQRLLQLSELPQPDDAADALAIAICHLHSYRMNEREKK